MTLFIIFYSVFFFGLEIAYLFVAQRYGVVDRPNSRSSHNAPTVRGGGIIFFIAVVTWFLISDFQYPIFVGGLAMVSIVSFLDDVKSLTPNIRYLAHVASVSLLLTQIGFHVDWYWLPLVLVVITGILNAYNFMDGINGITGLYSLITLGSLLYINEFATPFLPDELLILLTISVCVFLFFNFRYKAKCFAGDTGSIAIGFILCFSIGKLINETGNFLFAGLLLVYGLDVITTIMIRFIRGENLLQAHRAHFYQFLVDKKKWSHLAVSSFYTGVQVVINVFVINFSGKADDKASVTIFGVITVVISFISFIGIRRFYQGEAIFSTGK